MRVALGVEYAGSGFCGWQTQSSAISVQATLEAALSKVANHPIQLTCAGRTDAGVHATGQVVHFDTDAIRQDTAWVGGCNALLPKSISVRWAITVDETFHARFSAVTRRYCYVICNTPMHSGITHGRATWYRHPLEVEAMQQGVSLLLGERDFSAFRSSQCESRTPMRCLREAMVTRKEDFVFIELAANAFLHHMVRNITGVLLRVGAGFHDPQWVAEVLLSRDRRQAAETASADGLYLVEVIYPSPWHFPKGRSVLLF